MTPEQLAEWKRDAEDDVNPPEDEMGRRVLALIAEVERLRAAAQAALEVSRDREAFVMEGPRAFARAERILAAALQPTPSKEGP